MILDYISLVIEDIKRKKFSSFLTLFAISLGIFSVFLIILLGAGFESSIKAEFEKLGTNRLYIASQSGGFTSSSSFLTDTEISLLKGKPYIHEVYRFYMKTTQLKSGQDFVTDLVLSLDFTQDVWKDLSIEILEGREPRPNEKYAMVIGPKAAGDLFDKELQIGSNVYLKGTKFKIVGITKEIGNPEDDSNVYVNINTLLDIFEEKDQLTVAYAIVDEGEDINIVKENVEILLENRLGEDTIEVTTPDQFLDQLSSILDIVKFTLGGIAFVAIIVGALGIINTMYVIVTEKTKDIGIMKSVGARNEDILFIYMFQAGFFGLLGAILGIIFGIFGAIGFESFAKAFGYTFLEITIEPTAIIGLLIFGFVVGLIAGFLPAWKASKIIIVDTLRK